MTNLEVGLVGAIGTGAAIFGGRWVWGKASTVLSALSDIRLAHDRVKDLDRVPKLLDGMIVIAKEQVNSITLLNRSVDRLVAAVVVRQEESVDGFGPAPYSDEAAAREEAIRERQENGMEREEAERDVDLAQKKTESRNPVF